MSRKLPEKVGYEYVGANLPCEIAAVAAAAVSTTTADGSSSSSSSTDIHNTNTDNNNNNNNTDINIDTKNNDVDSIKSKKEHMDHSEDNHKEDYDTNTTTTITTNTNTNTNTNANANTNATATTTNTETVDFNEMYNSDGRLHNVSFLPKVLVTNPSAMNAEMPSNIQHVKGPDFDEGHGIDFIMNSFKTTGFQATAVADAVDSIKQMIHWRLTADEVKSKEAELGHLTNSEITQARCTIFLGLTSNQISCGQREVILFLCRHNMIDCIVTTGGAVEEDIMKLFNPHYMGDFHLKGSELRVRGINRIGNLVVPNKNYCDFEKWLTPILKQMLEEQRKSEGKLIWTPSKLIRRIGKEIDDERSVWYWCYKNNIPVFCPGIIDGAIGDILYFLSYEDDGFILDSVQDIRILNDIALASIRSGAIILGGGIVKHHILNANLMRNGANWSVFINTGHGFDGSDSGADPDEAVSWGKIRLDSRPVKIFAEATIVFPWIVAATFAHPKHKNAAKKPKRRLPAAYDIPQLR